MLSLTLPFQSWSNNKLTRLTQADFWIKPGKDVGPGMKLGEGLNLTSIFSYDQFSGFKA
jgi:hypothetical protein